MGMLLIKGHVLTMYSETFPGVTQTQSSAILEGENTKIRQLKASVPNLLKMHSHISWCPLHINLCGHLPLLDRSACQFPALQLQHSAGSHLRGSTQSMLQSLHYPRIEEVKHSGRPRLSAVPQLLPVALHILSNCCTTLATLPVRVRLRLLLRRAQVNVDVLLQGKLEERGHISS